MIHQRMSNCCSQKDKAFVELIPGENDAFQSEVICPIIAEGDAIGAVIIASRDEKYKMGEVERNWRQQRQHFWADKWSSKRKKREFPLFLMEMLA